MPGQRISKAVQPACDRQLLPKNSVRTVSTNRSAKEAATMSGWLDLRLTLAGAADYNGLRPLRTIGTAGG